jgi:hypothetical protein
LMSSNAADSVVNAVNIISPLYPGQLSAELYGGQDTPLVMSALWKPARSVRAGKGERVGAGQ